MNLGQPNFLLTVQPVPTPASHKTDSISNNKDGGSNQKLMLFILGNAISGAPIISGTNQFYITITATLGLYLHRTKIDFCLDVSRVVSEDPTKLSQ